MNTREDRQVRRSHRRLLTPALLIALAVAVGLIAFGSDAPVVAAAVDARTAAAIAAKWAGIPVGTAIWLALGAVALVIGAFAACRAPRSPRLGPLPNATDLLVDVDQREMPAVSPAY